MGGGGAYHGNFRFDEACPPNSHVHCLMRVRSRGIVQLLLNSAQYTRKKLMN